MTTECYAQVRGSALRVTALDNRGYIPEPINNAVSRKVATVSVNEVVESGASEFLRSDTDVPRMYLRQSDQMVGYTVDIDFLRVDPGLLYLMTGQPVVTNAAGDVVGMDAKMRLGVKSFALEVWSKLTGTACVAIPDHVIGFGEGNFGFGPFGGGTVAGSSATRYGYTLFPFLKGGYVSGFVFSNGLVSFNLRGAKASRGAKWGNGPYNIDISGGEPSLLYPGVSRNTTWRNVIVSSPPPDETDGISVVPISLIDGGTAFATTADILDGEFVVTSSDIIDGGIGANAS